MSTPVGDAHVNVNANTDPASRALRDFSRAADGRLRDMRGRFVSESRLIGTAFNRAAGGGTAFNNTLGQLKRTAISLAPALIPIAAQALPIAASVGAATVAVGAFAAAAAGQVTALSEASEAEKKYKDAVSEHGAASKQASDASAAYARQMAQMPPATRQAAVALSSLKSEYREWSDSLASSTMPVATKAMQTFGAVFPKLTPMVQGAGTQLDRFVTIAAGGVASSGFDQFMRTFSEFATGALAKANDGLIRFMRTADTGKVSGAFSQFMEYARANGPLVQDTLAKLGEALSNLLQAASNVGPGLLTVVNALAGIVAAVPPGVITTLLQLAIALKAVRLAAVAMAATSGAVAGFTASIAAMRLAAAGATGVLPRLGAAMGAMSRSAKLAVAGTGIGLLLIALSKLSDMGKTAPPDVDRLTVSLKRLADTGKFTGELQATFGSIDGLVAKMKLLDDATKQLSDDPTGVHIPVLDDIAEWIAGPANDLTKGSKSLSALKDDFTGLDKAMAGLVSSGNGKMAAQDFNAIRDAALAEGHSLKEINSLFPQYKAAVADAKFEQELATKAMGIFGQQAQDTSAKLTAQRGAADGLRAAITALNEVNQSAYGAQIQFEAAVDSLTASFKEHGATLNLDTAAGQANGQAMLAAAKSQDELIASGLAAGSSLESMAGKSDKLRETMLRLATDAFDGNKKKAQEYTNTLLGTPSEVKTLIKAERADAVAGLKAVQAEIQKTPGAKTVKVDTLNGAAIAALEAVGLKTKQLPDGRTEVFAKNGQAIGSIGAVSKALSNLNGKTATTWTYNNKVTTNYVNSIVTTTNRSVHETVGATGGLYTGKGFKYRGYARGGLVDGPGTTTSDDVYAPWLSKDEFVVNAKQTAKHLPLLKAINSGGIGLAAGGMAGAGADAGTGLASGLTSSTGAVLAAAKMMAAAVEAGIRQELEIASPSKKTQALAKDVGAGFIKGLTGSRDKIKAVAKDLSNDIKTAFSGKKESSLLKMVARETDDLLKQAAKRDAVSKKIAEANKFAADTANASRATGSLASIVQDDAYSPKYVEQQMKASLAQIKSFTSNVSKLQKKGVNKDLLRQILEMGPEQGAAFAQSLAGADAATIKRYNSLNTQISSASSKLGKSGADMLYDSGKNAGKGFLTGLQGQKKDIEKLMLNIAKGMQAAIKKALGIKSPSRVMDLVGRMTVHGLRDGITRSVPIVQTAMDRVSAAVRDGAPKDIRAAVAPAVSRPALAVGERRTQRAAASQAAAPHITVVVQNNGVLGSRMQVEDWLAKSLDNLARTNRLPRALRGAA
ncbi:hypothetical protein OG252_13030 [Streptomyces sp. NBC_01352]|uniref:hypothetical protein n=1 Tax=Streptomyces sp. NBC_01352 TaxID=2903834 RepID=UPI002E338479|nr:hypothetical protein [Streptomyces sp. NBC_01352]